MEHSDVFSTYVWPYANFFIFLWILCRFGKKPLTEMAEKKKEEFETLAQAAEQAEQVARERAEALDQRLSGLQQETEDILKKSREEAARLTDKMKIDAERVATQLADEALRLGEQERRSAQDRLRQDVEAAVAKAFEKKIQDKFQADDHLAFIKKELQTFDQKISQGGAR